jgi:DNA-binding MarR family transcriptional regulator
MNHSDTLTYTLFHVASTLEHLLDQTLQEQLGIGIAQYRILLAFEKAASLSQRDIAEFLNQTEAGISRQIKLLCEKDLVRTQVPAHNRRQRVCYITPKGTKIFNAAQTLVAKTVDISFASVSDRQQKQLLDALAQVHTATCKADPLSACKTPY